MLHDSEKAVKRCEVAEVTEVEWGRSVRACVRAVFVGVMRGSVPVGA